MNAIYKDNTAHWDAIYKADAEKAMKSLQSYARKIGRMLDVEESGEGETERDTIYTAIRRLETMSDRPVIRVWPPAVETAHALIRDARDHARGAIERGFHARQDRRGREIDEITRKQREENAGLCQYERDIRVMRGGRMPDISGK